MSLEQLYFFAEIIAASGVVISLIYLGVQIKRSRIQSENEAMDSLTNARLSVLKALAEHEELSRIIPKGLGSVKLTPKEYFRFANYLYNAFSVLEMGFLKWKRKDVKVEIWKSWKESLEWWLKFPSVKTWWKKYHIGGFTDEFKVYVNSLIENVDTGDQKVINKEIEFMATVDNDSL